MIWFFIVSVSMWIFSIVYVWKAKEYLRDEMRIVRKMQNDFWELYDTVITQIGRQTQCIKGWEHRLDIVHRDVRKLKKSLKQEGDTNV